MTTIRSTLLVAAVGLAIGASACSDEPSVSDANLESQLRRRAFLDVSTSSTVDVSAMARGGNMVDVDTKVLGGEAVLRATTDDYLLVEDLEIPLQDVTAPAGAIADEPVTFTDIALRLGTQLAIKPVGLLDDESITVAGWGQADLLIDWAMRTRDGAVLPLAMRRVEDAPFAVTVAIDADGRLQASISTHVDGEVDRIAEMVVLQDLTVDVVTEMPPIE